MYRGKSCSLERKGRNQYAYRDAFMVSVRDARGMLDLMEQQLAQARRRVEDVKQLVELMQREIQAPPEHTGPVKRYAPGATGDVAAVAAGAPPPIPIDERKKASRSKK